MPRPVEVRASYRDDAAFLLRLEAAVSKDDRQTAAWRQETCKGIRELAQRLLQANQQVGPPDGAPKAAARMAARSK